MALVRTPDIILFDAIKIGLKYIDADWKANTDKTLTWLYKSLDGISIQKIDYLNQAESIFVKTGGEARKIDVNMMYNMKEVKPPAIHITLGNESISTSNGLGMEEGYIDPYYNELGLEYQNVFTRRYSANYNIVVTSDNSNEVAIIYHVLKTMFTGMYAHLHLRGIENLKFSGADLNINQQLMPKHMYSRALSLVFEYETSAPEPIIINYGNDFDFNGIPVLELSDDEE